MSRTHEPVPVHAPPHAVNLEVESGVAMRVTDVPLAKEAEQTPALQLIPAGVLVTLPLPVEGITVTDAVNGPADEPPVSNCW